MSDSLYWFGAPRPDACGRQCYNSLQLWSYHCSFVLWKRSSNHGIRFSAVNGGQKSNASSTMFPTCDDENIEPSVQQDLDFRATVTKWETVGLHLAAFCFCFLMFKLTKLSKINPMVGLGLALLWSGSFGLARSLLLEAKYQVHDQLCG